jgi:hypothetical protein
MFKQKKLGKYAAENNKKYPHAVLLFVLMLKMSQVCKAWKKLIEE